jgi:hypothetical protein
VAEVNLSARRDSARFVSPLLGRNLVARGAFPALTDATNWSRAMLGTILLIILIVILIGAIPAWPYSRGWGYGPSGILGIIVIVLLILVLMGRL